MSYDRPFSTSITIIHTHVWENQIYSLHYFSILRQLGALIEYFEVTIHQLDLSHIYLSQFSQQKYKD